jgi:hypothetical protein
MPAKGGGFQRGHKPHHPTVKRRLEEEGMTGFEAGMGGSGQTDVKMLFTVDIGRVVVVNNALLNDKVDLV